MYVESMLVNSVGMSYRSDLAYLVINRFIPYKTPVKISNYIPKSKTNRDAILLIRLETMEEIIS